MIGRNAIKTLSAMILCVCMITAYMPLTAFAADETTDLPQDEQTQTEQIHDEQTEAEPAEDASETAGEEAAEEQEEDTTEAITEENTDTKDTEADAGPAASEEPAATSEPAAEPETEDPAFRSSREDRIAYDPLFIAKYADPRYVNAEDMDMLSFINIVTGAKGIATYNNRKQSEFDVDEDNYIAGLTYEIPVYDIDEKSDYYVCVPSVNRFNDNFREYDIMAAYNNDYAEMISGCHYEKGILYIPKKAVDHPSNSRPIPQGVKVAVQINYAIGGDMDFSKDIPVQVLSDAEPVNKIIHTDNIFDRDLVTIDTGVKGRKTGDITVYLNGQLIPINEARWSYDRGTGRLDILEYPGVISGINIVFSDRTLMSKAGDMLVGAIDHVTQAAYAVTGKGMDYFKDKNEGYIELDIPADKLFVGWRGHYKGKVIHGNSSAKVSQMKNSKGYMNSVKYMYSGYSTMSGDGSTFTDAELDKRLAPTWAVSSYALAADVGANSNYGSITVNEKIKHWNTSTKSMETHTIYEWLLIYKDKLEKSNLSYGGGAVNGLGGTNNFAFALPKKVSGADTSLVSSGENKGRANKSITITSDELKSAQGNDATSTTYDYYIAASCNHLDSAEGDEGDSSKDIYVTCLDIGSDYVVLAFCQSATGFSQNACGIYKFKTPQAGFLQIQKKAAQIGTDCMKECPGSYSLEGAEYKVYTDKACTKQAVDVDGTKIKLVTNAKGKTPKAEVLPGTYYIKETKASPGFSIDVECSKNVYTVAADKTTTAESVEKPVLGFPRMTIVKEGAAGDWHRLLGAEFRLSYYAADPSTTDVTGLKPTKSWLFAAREGKDEKGSDAAVIDLSTDEPVSGDPLYEEGGVRVLPAGIFTIEEINAPEGFARDDKVHIGYIKPSKEQAEVRLITEGEDPARFSVSESEGTQFIHVVNKLQSIRLTIDKSLSGEAGYASLKGAEYEVIWHDPDADKDVVVGRITTDARGHGELSKRSDIGSGDDDLPPGTYYIREIKAPSGCLTESYYYNDHKKDADRDSFDLKKSAHVIEAVSKERNTQSFTYGTKSVDCVHETYISKTDITGRVPELAGATLQVLGSGGEVIEEWTTGDEPHVIYGLSDGKYTLREIAAPEYDEKTGVGYDTAPEDVAFEVKSSEIRNTVTMDNKPVRIHTTALNKETGSHTCCYSEHEVIVDTVAYENLVAGRNYTVKGVLMDKETGEPLLDKNGEKITSSAEFTPPGDKGQIVSGTVDVELVFDASSVAKYTTAVVFEDVFREGRHIASHADINDEAQSLHYPGIVHTTAVDKASKTHNLLAGKEAVILDIVEYRNLVPGEKYRLEGELYDKETGESIGVKGSAEFVPEEPDGTVDVEFRLDATELAGHTLVVFEDLTTGGVTAASHADIEDGEQTIYIPEIHTTATGTDTKEHITYADKDVSITDVVEYSNLIPGKEYVMTGILMDKETGKPLTDGLRTVTASQTFTPEAADGQVELTFTFKGVKLAGREIVAFEECTVDRVLVAVHADLNDEKQTVNIPEIGTTAAILDKTVTDTIRYENLVPGQTYVIRGWLMDTRTGKRIEGSEGSTRFEIGESGTKSAVSGEIKVELPVSKYDDLRGRKVTAFEELYLVEQEDEDAEDAAPEEDENADDEDAVAETKDSGSEIMVAEHKDLKCIEQTVDIPPAPGTHPQTGDDPMIWLYLILFAGSFLASLTYVVRHVRNH